MTTNTLGRVGYARPATTSRFSGLLRMVFGAGRNRDLSLALSEAAHLGPEQLKEIGAYADEQTGFVYSTHLAR